MVYKRATAQLRDAGIDHIVIVKRLWGAAPEDPRLPRQTSVCFASPADAVNAVLHGFRPQEGHHHTPGNTPCGGTSDHT